MASAKATAKLIRENISSTTTCTPTTVTSLSDLLLPKTNVQQPSAPLTAKKSTNIKSVSSVKPKSAPAKPRTRKVAEQENAPTCVDQLSAKERSILATEIINSTLKSLTDAIKAPAQGIIRQQSSSKDLVKASARKTLRRSNSLPQSPLQPRSLKRVTSSPTISNRHCRSPSSVSVNESGYRSTGECARVAFSCLRTLQASKALESPLPALQLENGMSVLIGKLLLLGLDDLAVKELRILKKRLHPEEAPKKGTVSKSMAPPAPQTLSEVLDFGNAKFTGAKLGLVIATQLQVLRLMAFSRKVSQIERALPFLCHEYPTSPSKLISIASKETNNQKELEKLARQLQSLSDILFSLCPSVSSVEDAVAMEPKLSIRPEISAQIQVIGLHSRGLWWKLAGHKGDVTKEFFDPLLRCISAFARRTTCPPQETYQISVTMFENIQTMFSESQTVRCDEKCSSLSSLYRLLGSLSKDAGMLAEAIDWTTKFQASLDEIAESETRKCSITARLVALKLKKSTRDIDEEGLLMALLEGLEKPFKGESAEIDDLMVEVSYARRAANGILSRSRGGSPETCISHGLREMCESLIFLCPRLSLRYLGNPLDSKSAPRDVVRQDQRRQLITASALHSIDSVLFLIRVLAAEERLTWDLIDSRLQDCLLLHGRLNIDERGLLVGDGQPPPAYSVRISNLYYSQFLSMRRASRNPEDAKQFRALRRSVECVRASPAKERQSAYLWTKLERMADVCKQSGRFDELLKTLVALRNELIEQGQLSTVTSLVNSRSLSAAWGHSDEISVLGRTTQSIIKVEIKFLKITEFATIIDSTWSDEERAVVLENLIEMLSTQSSNLAGGLLISVFKDLLKFYNGESYPVRRLRVLLQLFTLELEKESEVVEDLTGELRRFCQENITIEKTKDEGLRSYFISLRALAATNLELRQDQPSTEILKTSLSTWSSLRERCKTAVELEGQIDDVNSLLNHLQIIADYMQVQGHGVTRLAALRLIADFHELYSTSSGSNALVACFTSLGAQWMHLGYSGKAGMVFDKAKEYSRGNDISTETMLQLHVSYAQYLLAIGNHDKCEDQLILAKALFFKDQDVKPGSRATSTAQEKTSRYTLNSRAYLISSMLALERGAAQLALSHAKLAIRLLRHAWARIESQNRPGIDAPDTSALEVCGDTGGGASQFSLIKQSYASQVVSKRPAPVLGSSFWHLITPLFDALNFVANIYAHTGMFLETNYYLQEGHKLVTLVGSENHIAMSSALLGSTYLKAGMLEKGSEYLKLTNQCPSIKSNCQTREGALLAYHTGIMHGLLGDRDAEMEAYNKAELTLGSLVDAKYVSNLDKIEDPLTMLEERMAQLSIPKPTTSASRKTTARSKTAPKRQLASRPKSPEESKQHIIEQCPLLESDKAMIQRQKARSLTSMKRPAEAHELLKAIDGVFIGQMDNIDQKVTTAKQIFQHCLEQMAVDPAYSVLQESTLSFPAVAGSLKADKFGDRLSFVKTPPRKAAKNGSSRNRSKSPMPDSLFDRLRQAQEHLIDAQSIATSIAPMAVIHNIATLLNSVTILLSAFGQVKGRLLPHPELASCSVEIAKNLGLRRERRAVEVECATPTRIDSTSWPTLSSPVARRSSISGVNDLARFQQNYIDIIPKAWTAISIALSDSRDELSITKFQAGNGPFVLRLPLGRHNSMDADEEVFGFEQGYAELREIIELANESAHAAWDMSTKEAKAAWWEEREALDARLRDLLENIEKVWLGGFTGIFSQHARRADLLARFQKSLQNTLDKYLPSRRKTGKKAAAQRITLDSRILDLFVGLGNALDENCDFSEPLTDLLNFVVDVLQIHGEQNEYAEIDFDSIVIEMQDALRGYHAALSASGKSDEGRHTILILDKALLSFPWESLPCLEGLAVSRLPSLGALRERILKQQEDMPDDSPEGQYIDRDNGAFILNPGGDLKNTQALFTKGLQSLNWNGIVRREPTEDEIKSALLTKDLYLYFGHGSGAQYIRAKEIRRLDKCAVSWLMGCSSGALTEAGEFEPYGPAINYMHAGCPALVATLWDVTDRDIDRFAKSAFEHWGLFEKETVGKVKGKRKLEVVEESGMSLVEAVGKGREACNLKYLNAAAVVVYGVPVYFR